MPVGRFVTTSGRLIRTHTKTNFRVLNTAETCRPSVVHTFPRTSVMKLPRASEQLKHTNQGSKTQELAVLQWNTLADGLAQFGNFSKVSHSSWVILA